MFFFKLRKNNFISIVTLEHWETSRRHSCSTEPSKPKDVEVIANGPNELHVKWTKPKKPNGEIAHYVVSFQEEELNKKEFDKRDYCKHRKAFSMLHLWVCLNFCASFET